MDAELVVQVLVRTHVQEHALVLAREKQPLCIHVLDAIVRVIVTVMKRVQTIVVVVALVAQVTVELDAELRVVVHVEIVHVRLIVQILVAVTVLLSVEHLTVVLDVMLIALMQQMEYIKVVTTPHLNTVQLPYSGAVVDAVRRV